MCLHVFVCLFVCFATFALHPPAAAAAAAVLVVALLVDLARVLAGSGFLVRAVCFCCVLMVAERGKGSGGREEGL